MALHTFPLVGDHIELFVLLKLLGLAPSGGAAKSAIAAGHVSVDGVIETRKARKIRVGQLVRLEGEEIRIVAAATED